LARVFVVGSINQDFVLKVKRRPEPGETVTGAQLSLFPGGKGANQAVAAARLGAEVAMFGRVGEDPFGEELDASRVESLSGVPTGSAFITVTPDGENTIIVSPGANRSFGPEEIEATDEGLMRTRILVAQLEVDVEAVETAAHVVHEAGGRFLLNLAPPREVPDALLRRCDPLVINEHEARFLLGEGAQNLEGSAGKLLDLGPRSAVITLGAEGALLASGDSLRRFPAPEVEAVDTTGAGDAFVGALAAKLARGAPLEVAVSYAVLAGAAAVMSEGAQGSLPTPEEVEKLDAAGPYY
jgi:ribokinase